MSLLLTLALSSVAVVDGHAEEGFIPLFDGKTLAGWQATEENPDSFSVNNGELVVSGDRGHLFYSGDVEGAAFTNFELRLKVKTTPGSNSGVYFHTAYQAEGWPAHGLEAQVNSTNQDPRKTGSIYAIADIRVEAAGSAAPAYGWGNGNGFARRPTAPSTDGEWFDYTVRVQDMRVEVFVNGVKMTQWTQPDTWPDETRRLGSGTFALQAHDPDSTVYYKDIRVKVLD